MTPTVRFTPRQLDTFIAAAELSNFTEAARRLHLTPSAVSNLIGELEQTLGFSLFERTTRKVVLTPDGREFLPAAMGVQRQLNLAAVTAADVRKKSVDIVRVAAPLSVAALILPALIADYRTKAPRVVVRIIDTGVEWLADRVATGEADIAVGPERVTGADVVCVPLYETPWVLWCSPDHQIASKTKLTWENLEGVEICVAGRDHLNSVAPQLKAAGQASLMNATPVDNLTTAMGMAAANLAVTLSPDYVVALATSFGLVKRPITEPTVIRHMTLYSPARRTLSAASVNFEAYVRSVLHKV